MWRQAVNRIVVQLGASPLGGFALLSEVMCTGCIRWSDSRESMQYVQNSLISLHFVGTRLIVHAPVYKATELSYAPLKICHYVIDSG